MLVWHQIDGMLFSLNANQFIDLKEKKEIILGFYIDCKFQWKKMKFRRSNRERKREREKRIKYITTEFMLQSAPIFSAFYKIETSTNQTYKWMRTDFALFVAHFQSVAAFFSMFSNVKVALFTEFSIFFQIMFLVLFDAFYKASGCKNDTKVHYETNTQ